MQDHRLLPSLGAMLFVPTVLPAGVTRIVEIGNGHKFEGLRTVIFDLEDSLRPEDVPLGMSNIAQALGQFEVDSPVRKFIRVRDPRNFSEVLALKDIDKIQGFVLPKLDTQNVRDYFKRLPRQSNFSIMPILETLETFSQERLLKLRDILDGSNLISPNVYGNRIQCILIGAMDLLKLLRIQPEISDTIYDTVIASVIDQIVTIFTPSGYKISGTIYRGFGSTCAAALQREVELDTKRGMFSKLAIHPSQLEMIEKAYAVKIKDALRAAAILAPDAPGVFQMFGEMCEPATQADWAERIFARLVRFGLVDGEITQSDRSEPARELHLEIQSDVEPARNLYVSLRYKHIALSWSQHSDPKSNDCLNSAPLDNYQTAIQFAASLGL